MGKGAQKDRRAQVVAGILIAVAVAGMPVLYFSTKVCDDQATSAGKVVNVCRHMQATDAPILALGVLLLVGLGAFFTEISIFGFTVKRQLADVMQKQAETEEKADKTAERLNETAGDAADFHARMLAQQLVSPRGLAADPPADLASLAERYSQLRWTMPSGSARTVEMTKVVRDMQDILGKVPEFDVAAHLNDADQGIRLAAYAYLSEHNDPDHLRALVDATVSEDKAFGQYWGLLAIRHQLTDAVLDDESRRKLTGLREQLNPGTDRAPLLREILGYRDDDFV